jgi:hypothetical protein
MVRVKVYVEGGAKRQDLKIRCREGFSQFFANAGFTGRMPRVIVCGGRKNAYDSFCRALCSACADEFPLLLVDSEIPVPDNKDPWDQLMESDEWRRPDGVDARHAHLMVQCMESWFLADVVAVSRFFGQGFLARALPRTNPIREVNTEDLLKALDEATRRCVTKGKYDKSQHSFGLLSLIDPEIVRRGCPHVERLLTVLDELLC